MKNRDKVYLCNPKLLSSGERGTNLRKINMLETFYRMHRLWLNIFYEVMRTLTTVQRSWVVANHLEF
jgi:hypothetical protein